MIAVDLQAGKVTLDDSGVSYGQGMVVGLGAFMNGCQSVDYELTIVSADAPAVVSV